MTSQYVVSVETVVADTDTLKNLPGLVDSLVREDDTAILDFAWEPDDDGTGAETWDAAKTSVEHVRSTLAGLGLPVGETRILVKDIKTKTAKTTAPAKRRPRSSSR
jgi:hypothetical protein